MHYKYWKFKKQSELENYMHNVITVLRDDGIETIISTNNWFSYDFRIHDPVTHQIIEVCIDKDAFVTGFSCEQSHLAVDRNHKTIIDRITELYDDKNPISLDKEVTITYADKVLRLKQRRDYIESTLERS